jgi:hypothetical protein
MIGLSEMLRETLTGRFGVAYRARTTEELSADSQLRELLGIEHFEQFIRLFDQIDQLKFGPHRTNHQPEALVQELAEWGPRVDIMVTRLRAKASGKVSGQAAPARATLKRRARTF